MIVTSMGYDDITRMVKRSGNCQFLVYLLHKTIGDKDYWLLNHRRSHNGPYLFEYNPLLGSRDLYSDSRLNKIGLNTFKLLWNEHTCSTPVDLDGQSIILHLYTVSMGERPKDKVGVWLTTEEYLRLPIEETRRGVYKHIGLEVTQIQIKRIADKANG